MANPTTGSNVTRSIAQTSQYIQEKWSREIEQPFDKELQIANLVQDRSGLIAGGGDTINIPFASAVDARAKSASTAITYDSPEGAPITLAIDKHYYVARVIEDIVKVQNAYDQRALYTQADGEGIAKQIDTDLAALYSGLSQSVDSTGALTDAKFLTGIQYLDDADAPMKDRHFVFKPIVKKNLMALDKFVLFQNVGNSKRIGNGEIGDIYGINCHVSTNIATSTTTRNLLLHKEAFAMACVFPNTAASE